MSGVIREDGDRRERQWRILARLGHVDETSTSDETFSTQKLPTPRLLRGRSRGNPRQMRRAWESRADADLRTFSLKCATHCLVFIRRSCRCTCTTCRLEYYTLHHGNPLTPSLFLPLSHTRVFLFRPCLRPTNESIYPRARRTPSLQRCSRQRAVALVDRNLGVCTERGRNVALFSTLAFLPLPPVARSR